MASFGFAVTRAAARTTVGTQDVTVSGFGTPIYAYVFFSDAISDGTAADGAFFHLGCTDGTAGIQTSMYSQHGVANTNDIRWHSYSASNTVVATRYVVTTSGFDRATASFITDGVRLDWTTAPSTAKFVTVLMFNGTSTSVKIGTVNAGNASTTDHQTGVGFEADLLLTQMHGESNGNRNTGYAHMAAGAVNNDGDTIPQVMGHFIEQDNQSDGTPNGFRSSSYGMTSGGAWEMEFESFDSSGFNATMTATGNGGGDDVGYTAFDLPSGYKVYVGEYEAPTSTGDDSVTGMKLTPEFLLIGVNANTLLDTAQNDSQYGGVFGFAVSDGTRSYCNSIAIEQGSATTDTQCLSNDQLVDVPDHDGTTMYTGTLSSFDEDGVTINYSAVSGTARKWFIVAIGPAVYTGTAAATIGAATASGSGTFVAGAGPFTGSSAATIGAATASGSGTFVAGASTFTGSSAATIGAATASGSGVYAPGTDTGSAAATIGAATASGSGTFISLKTGSAAATIGAATASGTGTFKIIFTGSAAATTPVVTALGIGIYTSASLSFGTMAYTLSPVTAAGVGTFEQYRPHPFKRRVQSEGITERRRTEGVNEITRSRRRPDEHANEQLPPR